MRAPDSRNRVIMPPKPMVMHSTNWYDELDSAPYSARYPQYTTLPYPWQARFRLDSPRRRAL